MSGPSPDRVGTSDLYQRFVPEPLVDTEQLRDRVTSALENPSNAEGWLGILVPAVVSALLINWLRDKI
jgi:hypothetical protein